MDNDETIIGVCLVTDNRIASHIYGVSLVMMDSADQQLCADHTGYSPLSDAWEAIKLADQIIVPNKWTTDTLARLAPNVPIDKLDTAIDLQVLARRVEPHAVGGYTLKASAFRLGYRRIDYRGSPVWTRLAMDAVKRDGMICCDLYHHLLLEVDTPDQG